MRRGQKYHRHRLLIFDAIGRRTIFVASLLLFVSVGILAWDWYQPVLGGWLWSLRGVAITTAVFIIFYLFIFSLPAVTIHKESLTVRGLTTSLHIPISDVISVTPSKISKHYPVADLRLNEFYRISSLYEAPCALIELKKYPATPNVRRYLFPRVLFTPASERPGLILNVKDWLALSRQIEASRDTWLENVREEQPTPTNRLSEVSQSNAPRGPADAPLLLIIDDSPAQMAEIERMLGNAFRLLLTGDGVEALRLARQYKPDSILTDIHLPRLGGREFILTLRKHRALKNVPILLMAAENERQQAADILLAGANGYVLRPFTPHELKHLVEIWLDIRREVQTLSHNNELLRTKTLNQMAELVRQGELVNFLPATVAKEVMSGQISGRGESFRRQKVTVLFIDIVGFTDLTGRLDPALLAELLNEYLREITAVAISHNGTVDKFIGDAVMVLFGAPQEQEEQVQAWSAINAGLGMLKTIEHINFIWESRLPRQVQVRVGINTGYCTTGVFGNEMLQSYTVVGSAVNIAARLQSSAEPNSLLCSRATFEHVQERVYYREVGPLSLKGVNHIVEGFQILDVVQETPVSEPV